MSGYSFTGSNVEHVSASSSSLKILEPSQDWIVAGNVTVEFSIENTGPHVEFAQENSSNRIDLEVEWRSSDGKTGVGLILWSTTSAGLTLNTGEKFVEEVYFDPSKHENVSVPSGFVGDLPPYRKTVLRLVHWKNYSYGVFGVTQIEVTFQKTTHEGDLVIDGTQTYMIENCRFIQTGNIYVINWSKLTIINSTFHLRESFGSQFDLFVRDFGRLEIVNSCIDSDFGFCIGVLEQSRTTIEKSTIEAITCWDRTQVSIENSEVMEILIAGNSKVLLDGANVRLVSLSVSTDELVKLLNVRPIFYEYWNCKQFTQIGSMSFDLTLMNSKVEGWRVFTDVQSILTISNSTLSGIGIHCSSSVRIEDVQPGYCSRWSCNEVVLENSTVYDWGFFFYEPSCTVVNSTVGYSGWAETDLSVINSTVYGVDYSRGSGVLFSNGTIFTSFRFVKTCLFIHGNMKFSEAEFVGVWSSSDVTRDYNILLEDVNGDSIENVQLILSDLSRNVLWSGFTDTDGIADCSITFSDNNHTDVLRLQSSKDGFYNETKLIRFVSDTPIIINLTQKPLGDINEDHKVNIADVSLVAYSYGTKVGDERYSLTVDLDKDGEVNIVDITLVAKDYGRTA
jgi:hypothetical protein